MSGRPPVDLVHIVGDGTLPPFRVYERLAAHDLRVLPVHGSQHHPHDPGEAGAGAVVDPILLGPDASRGVLALTDDVLVGTAVTAHHLGLPATVERGVILPTSPPPGRAARMTEVTVGFDDGSAPAEPKHTPQVPRVVEVYPDNTDRHPVVVEGVLGVAAGSFSAAADLAEHALTVHARRAV